LALVVAIVAFNGAASQRADCWRSLKGLSLAFTRSAAKNPQAATAVIIFKSDSAQVGGKAGSHSRQKFLNRVGDSSV
jgi:hypothetical protein